MSPSIQSKNSTWTAVSFNKHVTSMSCKLESTIRSHDTGQQITDRCQLIITWYHLSIKYMVNQGCMSLPTDYLEHGRHVAGLHRRRRHANNTASHDNHEKINSWVSFTFYGYGFCLVAFGHWSSANTCNKYYIMSSRFLLNKEGEFFLLVVQL